MSVGQSCHFHLEYYYGSFRPLILTDHDMNPFSNIETWPSSHRFAEPNLAHV